MNNYFTSGTILGMAMFIAAIIVGDELSDLKRVESQPEFPVSAFAVEQPQVSGPEAWYQDPFYREPSIVELIKEDREQERLINLMNNITFTLWCEARSGGDEEMRRVASVIYHRARIHEREYDQVIHRPRQFSCWGADGLTPINQTSLPLDEVERERARMIALELIQGTFEPSLLADHFYGHDYYIRKGEPPPDWSKEMRKVIRTTHHTYLYASR